MRHPLDKNAIKQDIFMLLHLVYGAEEYADTHNDRADHPALKLGTELYWTTLRMLVSELLVGIAVRARIIFDVGDAGKIAERKDGAEVGYYLDESGEITNKFLTLREACNKILHAITVELEWNRSDVFEHWNGIILLKGSRDGKPWEVGVMVNAFASQISTALAMIPEREETNGSLTDSSPLASGV
jgi:hypothetical protein